MHSETSITIHADPHLVYALASNVLRWPERLPHYRSVRSLFEEGNRQVVRMAAKRDFVPVAWTAELKLFPDEPRMTFRHVKGVTRGMEVEWAFDQRGEDVVVTIKHDLRLRWPSVLGPLGEMVIERVFIANIAGKTLQRMKDLAESQAGLPSGQDIAPAA